METIQIKYLRDIEKISKIAVGDWIDLRCGEDTFIPINTYKLIPLGVAIKLPVGYEAIVAPRSSSFKNLRILMTNSIGVIDESYCGDSDEWQFPAYCLEGSYLQSGLRGTFIPKNTRICQFRIMKHQPNLNIVEVDNLCNKSRGGFGSTGSI